MSSNVVNQSPYLRTTRKFPIEDVESLSLEINKTYVEISNAVNTRTIGFFASGRQSITGNSYFITSQRQQSQRQLYTFTSLANIPHNIPISSISFIGAMYGQYTDGTNWYGIIPATSNPITGQLSFYLTPTNIVFVNSGSPTLGKGFIVIEWVNQI
jgi:hypothetical protein